jgi:hypothetical protein
VPADNRGRLQAQGGGVEESETWAQDAPLPLPDGHKKLERLREKLRPAEQRMRTEAFTEATQFIDHVATIGGAEAGTKKSFPQKARRDHRRVDIEVHKGKAFVQIKNEDE